MPKWNPENYEEVQPRIQRFLRDHPKGRITTELVDAMTVVHDGPTLRTRWVVKSSVYRDDNPESLPAGTGYAFEIDGSGGANNTSALENCETSSTGRALAQAGYTGDKRVTREEMIKVMAGEVNERVAAATTKETLQGIYNELKEAGIAGNFNGLINARLKEIEGN